MTHLPTHWQSHAPASLMLFGEHAVLHGRPALACAMNAWLSIDWQVRSDQRLHIHSQLGEHQTDWHQLSDHPSLRFVLASLKQLRDASPQPLPGLSLTITSQINSTQGLGSSSASVAAVLRGLQPWLDINDQQIFALGLAAIQQVQGRGSGTDLAAALTGGVIQFDPHQHQIRKLTPHLPLVSVYSGYKTPTPQVIARVKDLWPDTDPILHAWLDWTEQVTQAAAQALQHHELPRLGQLMNMAHGLMHGLGVSDPALDGIAHQLRATPGILGAKISGSGLGDCVIGLGQLHSPSGILHCLPLQTTDRGAYHLLQEPPLT